jgi:hypothetical protein
MFSLNPFNLTNVNGCDVEICKTIGSQNPDVCLDCFKSRIKIWENHKTVSKIHYNYTQQFYFTILWHQSKSGVKITPNDR